VHPPSVVVSSQPQDRRLRPTAASSHSPKTPSLQQVLNTLYPLPISEHISMHLYLQEEGGCFFTQRVDDFVVDDFVPRF